MSMAQSNGIPFKVVGIEMFIKDSYIPASLYFIFDFFPVEVDTYGIKKKRFSINFTLDDILMLQISDILRGKILNVKKMPIGKEKFDIKYGSEITKLLISEFSNKIFYLSFSPYV